MTASVTSSLIIAGVAVLGCIASVAGLAFRVGQLIGRVDGHIAASEGDRAAIWKEIGRITARQERHVEIYHGGSNVRN